MQEVACTARREACKCAYSCLKYPQQCSRSSRCSLGLASKPSCVPACRDALLHVCRIHRVLMQPRGNALLVGVGGSGRKSLSRLAAYVAEQRCFTIEITKGYRLVEFREDLKNLYRQVSKHTLHLLGRMHVICLESCVQALASGRQTQRWSHAATQ